MQALTHSSQAAGRGGDNERLEFLGDRVLGLVIAQRVIETQPQASVGELAIRLNALVKKSSCARVAEAIGLGRQLRLGKGASGPGGMPGTGLLGDAMEALIAAVYLDGGIEPARQLVLRFWSVPEFDVLGDAEDPKSRLQSWVQARRMKIPEYRVINCSGPPHKPRFTIRVELESGMNAEAEASSKKLAESRAAEAILQLLGAGDG